MAKNKFPPADKAIVLGSLTGVKENESPAEYFTRVTAEAHDASDHKFESGDIPGVCKHCGWIHPELACEDCGEPMRDHAAALGHLLNGEIPSEGIIVVEVTMTRRRRGLLDFLN